MGYKVIRYFFLCFFILLHSCVTTKAFKPVFKGKIARSYEESKEWWPQEIKPSSSAPNIIIFLLDDVGFAHIGSFGGLINTPNIDKLASNGLRYNNFHTTSLCSPSRAALLAGRNPHSIGLGSHAITAMGFPGYNAMIPDSAKSVANYLKSQGYVNYALGKWDHTPIYEVSQIGPFDRWPSGEGFDHAYNFMAADVHQFVPVMWNDHTPEAYKKIYHLDQDLANRAIEWITGHKSIKPNLPFMMLWASGSVHSPHQAPEDYLDKYKGKFAMGWDKAREMIFKRQKAMGIIPQNTKLTKRVEEIPSWDSLTPKEKKLFSRQMEVFAAQLEFVDHEIGRVVATLERIGDMENTLIFVTSDNGASGEGGLNGTFNESIVLNGEQTTLSQNLKYEKDWGKKTTYPHYHAGWAMAGNTPFKYFKQAVHRGGQQDALIIHWPQGIKAKGEIRKQYHHIIDIAPTILEAAKIEVPHIYEGKEQQPMDGVSMLYSFNKKDAQDKKEQQYYEMFGNRAMYKDGFKAVSLHGQRMPWDIDTSFPFEKDRWELYHVAEDFSENDDLAKINPQKLMELKTLFDEEAFKYGVYPLYDNLGKRFVKQQIRLFGDKKDFVYYAPGATRIAESIFAPIKNHSHEITTKLDYKGEEQGVILAAGGMTGGFSLFIKDKKIYYYYNYLDLDNYILKSKEILPGKLDIKFNFIKTHDFAGKGELYINNIKVDEIAMPKMHKSAFSLAETCDIGLDSGTQVSNLYSGPFYYNGKIDKITIKIMD